MSHVAVVNCKILDLDAFAEAATKLGGVFKRDQKTFRMYDSPAPCIHAVTLKDHPGSYEVGLRYAEAGKPEEGFAMACDFYDGKITKAFGEQLVGLRNEYAAVVAENKLRERGYRVERENVAQQIRLVATR